MGYYGEYEYGTIVGYDMPLEGVGKNTESFWLQTRTNSSNKQCKEIGRPHDVWIPGSRRCKMVFQKGLTQQKANGTWNCKIPSGKHTKNYGKSPFFMAKSLINGHGFHSYVKLPEGISKISGARFGDEEWGSMKHHEASSGKGVRAIGVSKKKRRWKNLSTLGLW